MIVPPRRTEIHPAARAEFIARAQRSVAAFSCQRTGLACGWRTGCSGSSGSSHFLYFAVTVPIGKQLHAIVTWSALPRPRSQRAGRRREKKPLAMSLAKRKKSSTASEIKSSWRHDSRRPSSGHDGGQSGMWDGQRRKLPPPQDGWALALTDATHGESSRPAWFGSARGRARTYRRPLVLRRAFVNLTEVQIHRRASRPTPDRGFGAASSGRCGALFPISVVHVHPTERNQRRQMTRIDRVRSVVLLKRLGQLAFSFGNRRQAEVDARQILAATALRGTLDDGLVQRQRFTGATSVVVNLGERPTT